jgi:chemotaxis protein methyltransferase CheR
MSTVKNILEKPLPMSNRDQELEFTDKDFATIRLLVNKYTGISLSEHKRDLVYGRLSRRLRAHGFSRFSEYCELLEKNPDRELEHFTNAVTTNLTAFFRENHHFEFLAKESIPLLLERYRSTGRLRLWSAGCSTGEEAYSMAITLREAIPNIDNLDIRILATDLDSKVVQTAANGVYAAARIEGLNSQRTQRWCKQGKDDNKGKVKVAPELRKLITFKQLNLMHDWPMKGDFDAIFCRNVVIYFDKPTQQKLFKRFAKTMPAESNLFIGHSETLNNINNQFQLLSKTVYRRLS